ncbi:hypothetical protein [Geminocystis sp. GBBB08]|uniref:hypothetical protein n=1 Tax=Geminocystis sp. GBBB08 TaxID=2604140 RepID=UPI0027E2DDEE|nr:hypothetical protein [Geminocystis sp. GBBB08]
MVKESVSEFYRQRYNQNWSQYKVDYYYETIIFKPKHSWDGKFICGLHSGVGILILPLNAQKNILILQLNLLLS